MPSQNPASTLRRRAGSPSREEPADSSSSSGNGTAASSEQQQQPKTARSPEELIAAHPSIKPLAHAPATESPSSTTTTAGTTFASTKAPANSVASRILNILFKPFYFLLFAILHLGHEIMVSARTMKTLVQVFCLPHQFPISPGLTRVLRKDLGEDLVKKPRHLAVIMPVNESGEGSEEEEEAWHEKVAQLAQWSVASGIKCLSIMRTDPLHPQLVELLQERVTDALADFYKEEKSVPVARVRTLRPVEENLQSVNDRKAAAETEIQRLQRLYAGRPTDLDVVILAERDGHDRLAANVRVLGEAALQKDLRSQDITMKFLDQQLSADLSEPELLIVFKDDLDLSSYPPWHIRLTEIYHHPDQAIIPQYTMFLQALHRYAKCEQRFGK
ncbi:hypothetical protein BGZ58_001230 [Dissophora ornata]|nr:hypothetical protein BGZ58_001230 [Dissophora ornata]